MRKETVLTKPKHAAFTYFVFLASDQISPASVYDLIAETRQVYSNPLEVGEVLKSFQIGEVVHVRGCAAKKCKVL